MDNLDAIAGALLDASLKVPPQQQLSDDDIWTYGLARSERDQSKAAAQVARWPFHRWGEEIGLIVDRRAPFSYKGYEFLEPIYRSLSPENLDDLRNLMQTTMKSA